MYKRAKKVFRWVLILSAIAGLVFFAVNGCTKQNPLATETAKMGTVSSLSAAQGGTDKGKYDKSGYDKDGYNRDGYNRDEYDKSGYNRDGCDKNGYDKHGTFHGNKKTPTPGGTILPVVTATMTPRITPAPTNPVVNIGSAGTFAAFGGNAGVTNQGINTLINGNLGTTAASTLITGFHDSNGDIYTETTLNIGGVTGTIFTAPPPPGTAKKFAIAQQALADATTAFNFLAGLPGGTDPGAGELGNLVLAPGVYTAAAGAFGITSGDLTLDAQGKAKAVWVFQMASALTVGTTVQPRSIILVNGAQAKNVYWQVGSAATINETGGGAMAGTIISRAGITFSTAGNLVTTVLNGRALSLVASITMVNTVINMP